ncbi:MAG: SDR family oxidoreductase [Gammaproteobacteria bacterium]|nr:SDR family oxidoreductase [Gammaproteobacteria bacterium]
MSTTLVIGANGQIGRIFCRQAAAGGLRLRAMVRRPEQQPWFRDQGIETVVSDLESDFEAHLDGCQHVVFTAGSGPHTGPDRTLMIDLYGAMRAIDAALEHGTEQFLMVSAFRAEHPPAAPEKLRPYAAAKLAADRLLMCSGVPYTILRPGRLTDEPATGHIQVPPPGCYDPITISRENVALCMHEVLGEPWATNRTINLVDGDHPVSELAELVDGDVGF